MSKALWPHGLQHAKLLCPPLSPKVCSNSCPLSLTMSMSNHLIFCSPLLLFLSVFPSIRVFFNELALHLFVYKMLENNLHDQLLLLLSIFSHVWLWDPMDCSPWGSSVCGDSPGKNTRVGCYALPQGVFPTQGSNSGLPHCRWILYHDHMHMHMITCTWSAYHSKSMQHQSILYSPFKIDRWRNSTRKSLELHKKIW